MYYLAFDIGSSFTKLAVLDSQTRTAETVAYRPTLPRLEAPAGHFDLDAELLLDTVRSMLEEQVAQGQTYHGIFFSTQMHGFILTRNGRAITPYVTWQDARAEVPREDGKKDIDELKEKLGHECILSMGTRYKAGLAACSLYSMLKDENLDLEGARFETLGSFLISRLSDEGRHGCHLTDAASTGFAVAAESIWNQETIKTVGVQELAFPEIVSETEPLGTFRGIPFYAAIGDHQASVYGSGEGIESSVSLTIGTATIICAVAPGYVHADMEVRPYFDDQCLMTITRQPGGRVIDVVIELVRDSIALYTGEKPPVQDVWAKLLDDVHEDTQGLHVTPDFYIGLGEGSIDTISPVNLTASNLFCAALDSLAEAYCGPIERLRSHNPAIDRLILCGGRLSKLPALHERLHKKTGLPVYTAPHRDAAFYGLMRIAMKLEQSL